MKNQPMVLTTPLGWRSMWILTFFDLPTGTKAQRKRYTIFRRNLLEDGFSKMQYSVYKRHCATRDNAQLHIERMARLVPIEGEVRFLQITDKQFGDMRIIEGKKEKAPEQAPAQLTLL